MKLIKLVEFIELLKKYLPFKTVKITRQIMSAQEEISEKEEIFEITDEQKSHLIDIN